MPGTYLQRLNDQYDEIRDGIESLVQRAADDNRDVTDAEQEQVNRDRSRLSELQQAIEHYTALETQTDRVAELRRSVRTAPRQERAAAEPEPEYDIAREFPTPGDYAITVHRALMLRDPDAREQLERATQHQTTADNPGLIPRPILGPLLNFLDASRPFISAITRRPLPTGKFDRPVITQHVAVAKQAAEKDLTASQKLVIGTLPAVANTYAGHLNISRQDIKWTSPAILNIVFDDFAAIYAQVTDDDAGDQFLASITSAAVPVDTWDAAGITEALYGAATTSLGVGAGFPDTLFVSPDVWSRMGSMVTTNTGAPVFPSLSVTSQAGNPLGLKLCVDPFFPAGTMVAGPSRLAEWYEDVDGLLQVAEPDVLGQLVGYAGYGAFVNVKPDAFTKFAPPAPVGASSGGGSESRSGSSK